MTAYASDPSTFQNPISYDRFSYETAVPAVLAVQVGPAASAVQAGQAVQADPAAAPAPRRDPPVFLLVGRTSAGREARPWAGANAAFANRGAFSRGGMQGGFGGGGRGGGGRGGGGRRSDMRLKHDIVLLGRLDDGLGYYRFVYNGGHTAYVGVMAQEVQTVMPEAVTRGPDGYMRVFYDKLGLPFETYDQWVATGAHLPSAMRAPH